MKKQIFISGGLGNQMFQYAFYLSLKEKHVNCELNGFMFQNCQHHNGYELEDVFGISDVLCNFRILKLWYKFIYNYTPCLLTFKDPRIVYAPEVYSSKSIYYVGFWMNYQYFDNIKDLIKSIFVFKNIDKKNIDIAKDMMQINSVSLHIRRGDYLKNPIYSVCTEDYYTKAIDYINKKIDSPIFYIFSDDPDWCELFIKRFGVNYVIINHNRGKESYKDMYLMSHCKHNITANSTFSWWGAWLNANPSKIVVAPSKWWKNKDKNIVYPGWYKIDV